MSCVPEPTSRVVPYENWVTILPSSSETCLRADYTLEGPLLPLCGISQEAVKGNFERWLELANVIIKDLGLPDADQLGDADRFHSLLGILSVRNTL